MANMSNVPVKKFIDEKNEQTNLRDKWKLDAVS